MISEDDRPSRYCVPVKRDRLSDTMSLWATNGISQMDEVLNEMANHIQPGSRLVAVETNLSKDTIDFYFEV